jgi:hypothetical protein
MSFSRWCWWLAAAVVLTVTCLPSPEVSVLPVMLWQASGGIKIRGGSRICRLSPADWEQLYAWRRNVARCCIMVDSYATEVQSGNFPLFVLSTSDVELLRFNKVIHHCQIMST